MRQCLVLCDSGSQPGEVEALLGMASKAGLRHQVYRTPTNSNAVANWLRCYQHIGAVKTWTAKRPVVVVHAAQSYPRSRVLAGVLAGGDVVYIESECGLPRDFLSRLALRKARYAICRSDESARLMKRVPGCIVVNIGVDKTGLANVAQKTTDVLLGWSGGPTND